MQTLDEREKLEQSLELGSSRMRMLQNQDPILEELVSDYLVLARDLEVVVSNPDTSAENYLMDARDSLRALEFEISERVSSATQVKTRKIKP